MAAEEAAAEARLKAVEAAAATAAGGGASRSGLGNIDNPTISAAGVLLPV